MAKVTLNPALQRLSGRSGNLVFRQVGDRTIAAKRPEAAKTKVSAAQRTQRDRFRQATDYARRVLDDPCQRRAYERLAAERKRRADKLLTSDFLTPPVVEAVEVSGYRGKRGQRIRVLAFDDLEVVSVEIEIRTAAGNLVEKGAAVSVHGVWNYVATADAPAGERLAVAATAKDRPGNTASLTVTA